MAKHRRYTKRTDSLGRSYVIDTSTGKRAKAAAYDRETKRRAKQAEQARKAAERHERALRAAETRRQRARKAEKHRKTVTRGGSILRNKKALLAAEREAKRQAKARSQAALKGWVTRREREHKIPIEPLVPEGVTLVPLRPDTFEFPWLDELFPHQAVLVAMASRQTYDGLPVQNVHLNNRGWIVGEDAWGRPLRAIAILNTENNKTRIRWRDDDELPKRGSYLADEAYESLRPRRYVVRGRFQ